MYRRSLFRFRCLFCPICTVAYVGSPAKVHCDNRTGVRQVITSIGKRYCVMEVKRFEVD
jgi:hypothetical protein